MSKTERAFSGIEQRNSLRWPADFQVRYGTGDELNSGVAVDLSEGGLSFRGSKLYPTDSQLVISLNLPGKSEIVKLTAVVRRQDTDGLHGVKFIDVSALQKACVLEIIYHLITLRRQ